MSSKRILDVVGSTAGLVVTAPVQILIAVLVRRKLGRPVLFRQTRPGLHGEPFELIKFRTMTDARDDTGRPLTDEERITPFGALLRSTSLDELPELWNVLRGDMSLVGPRPLLSEYLPHYSARQAHRHDVRPGLTGWAQINGRNAPDWEDRLEMDVWYVENRSLGLDLRILLRTVVAVLRRSGISAEGHATAPKFSDRRR
jgi:lipopolysaccharide/colanic/teichoic acid biosynthesis glycosyltransferase